MAVHIDSTVDLAPTTAGGLSTARTLSLGVTGWVVKASAGQWYGYYMANTSAALRYVKVYDIATAPDATATPIETLAIPAGSAANLSIAEGIQFSNGIALRCTTGVADNDIGAPAANDVIVNVRYA